MADRNPEITKKIKMIKRKEISKGKEMNDETPLITAGKHNVLHKPILLKMEKEIINL